MNDVTRRGVLVLAGATAAGKTAIAIALARRFDAEIVGADSRQIYRAMPIGTAAPTEEELAAAPHHLVGFLDPHERYSAARFAADAMRTIHEIHARGKRAIVAGGTGFYIRALTGAIDLAPQHDERLRERLAMEARTHSAEFLHAWLQLRDPKRAAAVAPNDAYRVVRALEVAMAGDDPLRRTGAIASLPASNIPFAKLFLDVQLSELDGRIALRTAHMLRRGLIEEAERIGSDAVAATAVGYPQATAFLRGWSTRDELERSLARATRRYARRQRAWFRSEPQTRWVRADEVEAAAREMLGWS
ncbi:MAG TPA: tRNA (adenosine(37)-N6)-dimethylallyltransferase MiaA [Candidatus Dormibacteraeota bacterium]|nr:tRNA (adenosine(37)-N6)-dimethylallyltransferase MiaA [Candidatus Dormibacteraeota bacterium]